jgi:hypothetical protein
MARVRRHQRMSDNGVAAEISNDFTDLYENRNRLIHATWRIGHWIPGQNLSDMHVYKHRITPDSLLPRDDLPKNLTELTALATRHQKLHSKLGPFLQFYHYQPARIEQVFKHSSRAEKWQH